jgi:hypothetical protein
VPRAHSWLALKRSGRWADDPLLEGPSEQVSLRAGHVPGYYIPYGQWTRTLAALAASADRDELA